MTQKLLNMQVGEIADFTGENYDNLQTIKSRLKRNGKGQWRSILGGGKLMVERVA